MYSNSYAMFQSPLSSNFFVIAEEQFARALYAYDPHCASPNPDTEVCLLYCSLLVTVVVCAVGLMSSMLCADSSILFYVCV